MEGKGGQIYEFGEFRLDVSERVLLRESEAVPLTPKVFDLLVVLVENHGHLLTKDEIISSLWADSFVEEANLNVNMSALRRSLGETPGEQRFIETVPRQGYRFVAEVSEKDANVPALTGPRLRPGKSTLAAGFLHRKILISTLTLVLLFVAGFSVWRYVRRGQSVSEIRSIAVLPFRPLTKSGGDAALEMGMADALITKLSVLREVTVRPTGSVLKFSEGDADSVGAGRELQVEAVLEGRIQRFENRIRVTVQLLRVSDGASLWAESFDDYFTNIFALQDSISDRMFQTLSVRLSPQDQNSVDKRHTESTEAYQLYLQAQYHHLQISAEGSRAAINYYEQATKADPKYALAWAQSVGAYAHMANLNDDRDGYLQKARIAAYTALSLDHELPEAHEAVATILDFFDWNWPEAEREYLRAIELGPNRDGPHYAYSIFLSRFKRHDEAVKEIRIAGQILPNAVFVQNQLVQTLFRARRFEECITEANRSLQMKADGLVPLGFIFRSNIQMSKITEAESAMNRLIEIDPQNADSLRARLYIRTGRAADAEAIIRPKTHEYREGDVAWQLAQNYLRLGDLDKVFETLEHSFKRREANITMINVEPEWDPIRGDARYSDLMRRIGIPP